MDDDLKVNQPSPHETNLKPEKSKPKITIVLLLSVIATNIGSAFVMGYNISIANEPQDQIKNFFQTSARTEFGSILKGSTLTVFWSSTNFFYCIGGATGALFGGYLGATLGRKNSLLLNNLFLIVSQLCGSYCVPLNVFEIYIFGKFMAGVNSGVGTTVGPMYINEISPIAYRGAFGSSFQLSCCLGIFVTEILGFPFLLGTTKLWPELFNILLFCGLLQVLMLLMCPESPKYFLTKEMNEDAKKALRKLRNSANVDVEMREMQEERELESLEPRVTLKELFFVPFYRRPLTVAIVAQISQQLTGVNAINYYCTSIFKDAGFSTTTSTYITAVTGLIQILGTVVAILLIEKAGRKILLIVGLSVMLAMLVSLTVFLYIKEHFASYFSVASIFIYLMFYCLAAGPIPWLITAELFSNGPRPTAVAFAGFVNWLSNSAVGLLFPVLKDAIGDSVFLVFAAIAVFCIAFIAIKAPETKGKSIDEIKALFVK